MRAGASTEMATALANIASLLDRTAARWPRLPAIAHGTNVLHDYATLARRAHALAARLQAGGLRAGARVALVARNTPGYVETLFGCWIAGLVAVPVNAKLHPKELEFVLADSGARWAFVDDEWASALARSGLERVVTLDSREHASLAQGDAGIDTAAVAADVPAWLFYTSGTTGRPKGVEITHGNLFAMGQCFMSDVEAIAPGDALLHPAPLSHGSGLYVIPHVARGAVNVVPESGGFDPAEIAALVARYDRSLFFAAPTMLKRMVGAGALARDDLLARLKCIVYGGGPMYVADCQDAYAQLGPRLAQIYGQGESPMTITAMDRHLLREAIERGNDARVASVGCAQAGIDVRVAAADDTALGAGDVGEVLVRGPTVMRGYWRNPDASARTLANGWLHTGDLGVLDADGFLTLKDRSKDLIISGGSNIYPREVEEALLLSPDVAEVAVVGRAHPDWGEEVVACVVARGGVPRGEASRRLEGTLDALCLAHIARFKRPKAYVFVDALPKNNTGKVLKTLLRDVVKEPPVA